MVDWFMIKCTDKTGHAIFQFFKNRNPLKIKVKIVIELDLYFVCQQQHNKI